MTNDHLHCQNSGPSILTFWWQTHCERNMELESILTKDNCLTHLIIFIILEQSAVDSVTWSTFDIVNSWQCYMVHPIIAGLCSIHLQFVIRVCWLSSVGVGCVWDGLAQPVSESVSQSWWYLWKLPVWLMIFSVFAVTVVRSCEGLLLALSLFIFIHPGISDWDVSEVALIHWNN